MRWIIGDIHGMIAPLTTLLEAVGRADSHARFIFLGDYINRGPDSNRVLDLLIGLNNARFIRGNHEDVFDLVVNGHCYAESASTNNRLETFRWFMDNGMHATFLSYGANLDFLLDQWESPTPKGLEWLVSLIPQAHREFIRHLPAIIEEDDLFAVHAKWGIHEDTDNPRISQRISRRGPLRHRLVWGRYTSEEVNSEKHWRRTGYFGHTPVAYYRRMEGGGEMVPVTGPHIILLDTGAALSPEGRLSAVCPETGQCIQTDHFGHLVNGG